MSSYMNSMSKSQRNGTLLKKTLPVLMNYKVRQYNLSVHSFSQQNKDLQKELFKKT